MHSSIYSLNEQIPGFRTIRQNSVAVLLGVELRCKEYSEAAMRKLHGMFEMLARLPTSNARLSPIRASDVEFVCKHVGRIDHAGDMNEADDEEEEVGLDFGLRQLLFDAVASHWTKHEVWTIGLQEDMPGDTVSWQHVYVTYLEFRDSLMKTAKVGDAWRGGLLRGVDEYLDPLAALGGDGAQCVDGKRDKSRSMERVKLRIPSIKRSVSFKSKGRMKRVRESDLS